MFLRVYTAGQSKSLKNSWVRTSSRLIRCSGSFSSNRSNKSLNPALMQPILALIRSLSTLLSSARLQSSAGMLSRHSSPKGLSRKCSSNIRTPSAQKSPFCPNSPSPSSASGGMYSSEPTKVETDCLSSMMTFERPQSVSLMCPFSVTSRFQGLSSRQTTPNLCRILMPTTISATTPRMRASGKGISFLRRQQQSSPMGRYSMTMQTWVWFWKVSLMPTRNSCRPIRFISSHCITLNSRILAFSMIFIANSRPLSFSSASTTHPNAPLPRYFRDWQSSGPRVAECPLGVRCSLMEKADAGELSACAFSSGLGVRVVSRGSLKRRRRLPLGTTSPSFFALGYSQQEILPISIILYASNSRQPQISASPQLQFATAVGKPNLSKGLKGHDGTESALRLLFVINKYF